MNSIGAGWYYVVVTDANGCVHTDSSFITQPDSITTSSVITDVLCNGFSNGAVDLTVFGGVSPYTYNWSTGATTEDISGISNGTFHVDVTDLNGCVYSYDAIVIELAPILVNATIQNTLCYGDANGSISLVVTGGSAPYNYSWSTGSTSSNINGLVTGNYSLLLNDLNNCTYTDTFFVNQPDSITAVITSPLLANGHNISYFNGNDGSIELTVTGGTTPYTYNWSNGSTTQDLTNLTAGTYSVIITDNNGCKQEAILSIDQPNDLQLPQGFSPNNDGFNDVFYINGLEAYSKNSLTIFNRWGNIVYKKENYENDWNGSYYKTNEFLPEGTYFVILEISSPEKINHKGYVELRK